MLRNLKNWRVVRDRIQRAAAAKRDLTSSVVIPKLAAARPNLIPAMLVSVRTWVMLVQESNRSFTCYLGSAA
jgi:phospholipase C